MNNLFWLTDAQMARLQPFFPKSHGEPRVDDRRVLSAIIFFNRNGLRWCDAPKEYGPAKTLLQPMEALGRQRCLRPDDGSRASEAATPKTVMIDATNLKRTARRPACGRKRGAERPNGPPDRPHQERHEHQTACRH
jgi:transposase